MYLIMLLSEYKVLKHMHVKYISFSNIPFIFTNVYCVHIKTIVMIDIQIRSFEEFTNRPIVSMDPNRKNNLHMLNVVTFGTSYPYNMFIKKSIYKMIANLGMNLITQVFLYMQLGLKHDFLSDIITSNILNT